MLDSMREFKRTQLEISKLKNRIFKLKSEEEISKKRMEKKLRIDKYRTSVRATAFQHLDVYWEQKRKKLKFNKDKVGSLRSDWMLRKYILNGKYNAYKQKVTKLNVDEKHTFIKNRSAVRQRIHNFNRECRDRVESEEKDQLRKHNERKKNFEIMLKENYSQRILDKRNQVNENEKLISQLINEEQDAYNVLRNTLCHERNLDNQTKYDSNGCPMKFEFSKKDKLKVFDKNFIKAMKINSRSLTTRRRSNSNKSKCSDKGALSMNNSCAKEKKRSIFDDFEAYNRRKKRKFIPSTCKAKYSKHRLITAYTLNSNRRVKELLQGSQNCEWNNLRDFDFLWTDKPDYLSTFDNLTSKQTDASSRNFNIFSTK